MRRPGHHFRGPVSGRVLPTQNVHFHFGLFRNHPHFRPRHHGKHYFQLTVSRLPLLCLTAHTYRFMRHQFGQTKKPVQLFGKFSSFFFLIFILTVIFLFDLIINETSQKNVLQIKVCGLCCLVCALTCVLVTITTTVIHMNRLQTLKECVYTLKTRTCTCYSILLEAQSTNDDGMSNAVNLD